MERILVICNTYYQFIVASQMAFTREDKFKVSVLLSDQTPGMRKTSERLQCIESPFENVFYLKTKSYCHRKKSIRGSAEAVWHGIMGDSRYNILKDSVFDKMYFYNYDYAIMSIYDVLKKNCAIKCEKIEEGLLGYNNKKKWNRYEVVSKIRTALGKKNPAEIIENFYCFYPEFYEGELKTVKIPAIKRNDGLAEFLLNAFELKKSEISYEQKYIFFTSVLDFEGGEPIGEYELVCRVADLVGKNNLLIKVHPRDTREVYEKNGFCVDKNSAIPWEVIQLCTNLSGKVLLTATSGSILSTKLVFGQDVKAFFLYKLCRIEGNRMAMGSAHEMEKWVNRMNTEQIKIIDNVEGILEQK